jgi:hypothetical protein
MLKTEPHVITVPEELAAQFEVAEISYISCGGNIVGVVMNPLTFSDLKWAFRPLQKFNAD